MSPSLDINTYLLDALIAFMDDLYKNSLLEGQPSVTQQDPEEGFKALMTYLDLRADSTQISTLSSFNMIRGLEIEPYQFGVQSQPCFLPILRHNNTEDQDKCSSIQDLLNRATMSHERMTGEQQVYFNRSEEEKEDALRVDYFVIEGDVPNKISLALPRFETRFDPETFAVEKLKDTSPIRFEHQTHLLTYNREGTQVEKKLDLELDTIVCHRGNGVNAGHYITLKRNEDGSYTVFNDTQVYVTTAKKAEEFLTTTGYLATYRVKKVQENFSDIERESHITVDTLINQYQPRQPPVVTNTPDPVVTNTPHTALSTYLLKATLIGGSLMGLFALFIGSQFDSYEDFLIFTGMQEEVEISKPWYDFWS